MAALILSCIGELTVDHDYAVIGKRNRDVASLAFQHIGLVAKIRGLDLDLRPIRPDWRRGLRLRVCAACERDGGGRKRGEGASIHGSPP
jgi:hypothetical protein